MRRDLSWQGGIGADKSVVAYSAICAHKMTYPTRQVSFIGYRDAPSPVAGKGKVITCCSDRSVYDPSGGRARRFRARAAAARHDPPRARREDREILAVGTFRRRDVRGVLPQVRIPPADGDGTARARSAVDGVTVHARARELQHPMGTVLSDV
jgi:hypothetical protein